MFLQRRSFLGHAPYLVGNWVCTSRLDILCPFQFMLIKKLRKMTAAYILNKAIR